MISAARPPIAFTAERHGHARFFDSAAWKWIVVVFWTLLLFGVAMWTAGALLNRLLAQRRPAAPPLVALASHLLLTLPARSVAPPPARVVQSTPSPAPLVVTHATPASNHVRGEAAPTVPAATAPAVIGSPAPAQAASGASIAAALDGADAGEIRQIESQEKTALAAERTMGVHLGVIAPSAYRYLSKEELFALRLNEGRSEAGVYFLPSSLFKDGPPSLRQDELAEISQRMRRALLTAERPVVHFNGIVDAGDKQIALSQALAKLEAQRIVDAGIVALSLQSAPRP